MKHLDLFSGIGGFALAARWTGFETVGFCEIEEFPREVLAKNFPGVPIHNDIRELDGKEYEGIDIITGGYPCQPFSLAGVRKGDKDDRHLWPEMLRVIKQSRPTWIVAENVAGHITMGLDKVLLDLESEGYSTRAVVIPACAVDANHRRDRVWVLGSNAERLPSTEQERKHEGAKKCSRSSTDGMDTRGEMAGIIANSDSESIRDKSGWSSGKSREGKAQSRIDGEEQSMASSVRAEKEQRDIGARSRWPIEPSVCRVANGIPRRVDRLKGLGNAIVPQVAHQIFEAIKAS